MILIGLGSNLPTPEGHAPAENLRQALRNLEHSTISVETVSSFYESAPVPDDGSPCYVNAVASVSTRLAPEELLSTLLNIEARLGRRRSVPNAPRIIDLDLLACGSVILSASLLTLPHPRMMERAFVLAPLAEIAPDWRHAVTGESAVEALTKVDPAQIRRLIAD